MTRKLINDCFIHNADRMRHVDAMLILQSRISTVVDRVRVPITDAHGRVLAEDAIARAPVPAHTNAAVDGYSFTAGDAGWRRAMDCL